MSDGTRGSALSAGFKAGSGRVGSSVSTSIDPRISSVTDLPKIEFQQASLGIVLIVLTSAGWPILYDTRHPHYVPAEEASDAALSTDAWGSILA